MASIGKKLNEAREAKALSVEDVAHSTRINAGIIRKIEEDDFSNFASTGYAKSFLKQYGKHLDVDVSDAVAALDRGETEIIGIAKVDTIEEGIQQRIERPNNPRPAKPKRVRRRPVEKPGGAPVFLGFVLVVLILALGIFYYHGYQANSPEELKTDLANSLSKVGITSKDSAGNDLTKADSVVPVIEKNPLRKGENKTLPAVKPAPVTLIKEEKPKVGQIGKTEKIPPSRSRELPSVDFNEGPITAGDMSNRVPVVLPKPDNADQPAVLRPAGTDPVAKRKERTIIRAIPVAEPVVTNSN